MTFLNPLILFALAAAAIPLVIHLFNFRKPKRVNFSSLVFLHELQKSTMQRVRIKQWLLLALRTLAIAALVLAFARPTMTGALPGFETRGSTSVAIVMDNSESMSLRDGDGEYMEQARNIAAGIVEGMEPGDEVYVIPVLAESRQMPAHQNRTSAMQAVLEVRTAGGESRLSDAVRRASDQLVSSANPNREIYILSDLQRSTLIDSLESEIAQDLRLFLLPVGDQAHDNIAITDIELISQILAPGQPTRMEARVLNAGERDISELVVSLFLEDERVAQATVDVGAGDIASVPIAMTPRRTGWLRGRVEIQDPAFEADNTRWFTVFIPQERRLLMVTGTGASSSFLNLALSPTVTEERVRFDIVSVDESALASLSLGQFDAIILNGVVDLTSGERASVVQYVEDGGGLLVFPSDNMVLSDYNALTGALGGGSVAALQERAEEGASLAVFDRIDVEHPLFEGMFEELPSGEAPRLEQPEIFRLVPYQPSALAERTLIRLSGDLPFLQEIPSGNGRTFFYALAPRLSWSDLPVRGLFVPLLYRSVYYLSAAGAASGGSFQEGEAAQLRLSGLEEGVQIQIRDAAGVTYAPELRRLPGGVLANIEAGYLRSGVYDVAARDSVVRRFSVNPSMSESHLETSTPAEASDALAAELAAEVSVVELDEISAERLRERLQEARTGVEIWNVFLLLALAALVTEMLVEKKWRPESGETGPIAPQTTTGRTA